MYLSVMYSPISLIMTRGKSMQMTEQNGDGIFAVATPNGSRRKKKK